MRIQGADFIHGAIRAVLACMLGLGLAACERAPTAEKLAAQADAAERVESSAGAPGTALPAARSPVDDKTLTVNVRAALMASAALNATTIEVSARDGVVTLSGTTNTSTRRDLAAYLALRVDGVVSVRNRIAVIANS